MIKALGAVVIVFSFFSLSCSGGGSANLEVKVSTSPLPLIPAAASSCLSRKSGGTDAAPQDISASYFRVPTISFNRVDTTKTLIISLIRIRIKGVGVNINCEAGGDNLAALSSAWWATSTRDATIPVGTATYSTDCALYCGGVNTERSFTATGTLEIFGLDRDETTLEETPVRVSTQISVQSF